MSGTYQRAVSQDEASVDKNKRVKAILFTSFLAVAAVTAVVVVATSSSTQTLDGAQERVASARSSSSTYPFPDIYRVKGCPFSYWFSSLPKDFDSWRTTLVTKFKNAWQGACTGSTCPSGFAENDHNYNTVLGQGNTLGFLAGHLDIESTIPSDLKHGMFANPGQRFPAIVRLSDFGDDKASVRLGRLALKVPYPTTGVDSCESGEPAGSWYDEVNILFTESLDTFPLANFNDIAWFAGDSASSSFSGFWASWNVLRVLVRNGPRFFRDRNNGLLAKQYYSQTPYRVGCGLAGKFYLRPVEGPCPTRGGSACCVPNAKSSSRDDLASGVQDLVSRCEVKYELLVQTKSESKEWDVIHKGAATGWDEPYVKVATLYMPAQPMTRDNTATSAPLAAAIKSAIPLSDTNAQGLHKLFMFHPIMTATEHRPLGEVNTFRSQFYAHHTGARYETLLREVLANTQGLKPPYKIPFNVTNPALNRLFGKN